MVIMREPRIIDEIIKANKNCNTLTEINGLWYEAKPIRFYSLSLLPERFYHAWLVLIGKAEAIQYAEDSKEIKRKDSIPKS